MYSALIHLEKRLRFVGEQHQEISALFLFGSVLTRETPEDIDIAALIDEKQIPATENIFRYQFSLATDLRDVLERDDVDLVILNKASSVIGMQVLRKGKKIFVRDERVLNDYTVRTGGMYHDLKIIRRPIERDILRGRIYA